MADLHAVDGDTPQAADGQQSQSFDDFWAEVAPVAEQRTELILGVPVLVPDPNVIPTKELIEMNKLAQSVNEDDLIRMGDILFGEGAMADLLNAGAVGPQLNVVLVWGFAHAQGKPVTFRQAYEHVTAESEREEQGKVLPNRAARRAAVRQRSSGSGGRSRPTSPASTTSTRKGSDD